jgi:hypothetical protein
VRVSACAPTPDWRANRGQEGVAFDITSGLPELTASPVTAKLN